MEFNEECWRNFISPLRFLMVNLVRYTFCYLTSSFPVNYENTLKKAIFD